MKIIQSLSRVDVSDSPRRRLARALAGRVKLAGQAGFSMIEMLVATTAALLVVIGPLAFIVVSTDQQNASSSRSTAARQAEVGLQRLVRDLRGAMQQTVTGTPLTVTVSSTASPVTGKLVFSIPSSAANTTPQTVTWLCTVGATCTRQLAGGSAIPEITGITAVTLSPLDSSGAALTLPATNPAYVDVALDVQVTSQLGGQTQVVRGTSQSIKLQTGVDLRNFS